MASVLSHPAVALGFSKWFGVPRAAVAAGALLTVLPDADAVGFWMGVPYGAPLGHRGLSHSLAFAALLAAIGLALLRFRDRRVRVLPVFVFLFVCAASHGILDGLTNGGLGVAYFAPFSNARYFFPWRPIDVSPISVSGFFTRRAIPILATEALWIWLPCLGLALASRIRARKPAVD